jgi:hypothetical protein
MSEIGFIYMMATFAGFLVVAVIYLLMSLFKVNQDKNDG